MTFVTGGLRGVDESRCCSPDISRGRGRRAGRSILLATAYLVTAAMDPARAAAGTSYGPASGRTAPRSRGPGEVDLAFSNSVVLELGAGEGRDDVVQVFEDRGRAVAEVPPVEALLEDLRLPFLDFELDGAVRLPKARARPFADIVESARDEDGLLDGRARVRQVCVRAMTGSCAFASGATVMPSRSGARTPARWGPGCASRGPHATPRGSAASRCRWAG